MKRFTLISKDNEVYQFDNAYEVKNDDTSCGIIMDNLTGAVIVNKGNPITWPAEATDGLQAVVDVKAGTLRFGMNNAPVSRDEFVVSEYVEPFVSVEDSAPVHVLDLIEYWPSGNPAHVGFRPAPQLPTGFTWLPQPIHWILRVVGSPKEYSRDDWEARRSPDKPAQPGTKHDHGKPILGAVPPHAELAVGRVLTFGAEKYARGNWDKVEDHENRYMDAALRHLNAHRRGELTDSESGESHLAHAACCILFMLDKQERS